MQKGETRRRALRKVALYVAEEHQRIVGSADVRTGRVPSGSLVSDLAEDLDRASQVGRAMGLFVWDNQPFDNGDWRTLSVEKKIEVKIRGVGVPVIIQCDTVLIKGSKPPYRVKFDDFKTTSKKPIDRAKTLLFDVQPRLYRLALHTYLNSPESPLDGRPGRKCFVEGFNHSIIQTPTIRQKINQTWDAYVLEVAEWYKKRMEADPNNPPYLRSYIELPRSLRDPELMQLLKKYSAAANAPINLDKFYRVDSACMMPGRKPCEFLPLCSSDPLTWRLSVDRMYTIAHRDDPDGSPDD